MQMQEIKDRVTKVLDNKGVLTRLKAELRASVFLAINDQDIQQGGIGLASKSDAQPRQQLLDDPTGAVVVELVREFLRWCNLQFTAQVFEPEMQLHNAAEERDTLQQKLGLPHVDQDTPVLLQLLQRHSASVLQQTQHLSVTASSESSPAGTATHRQLAAEPIQATQTGSQPTADQTVSAAVMSKTAAVSHSPAAVMLASQSASIMEDIDMEDDLIDTTPHLEPEDEEYAAVFLAAKGPSEGCQQEREDNSSSNSSTPQQQIGRPVHWAQQGGASSTVEQQVTPESAAADSPHAEAEMSDSFGYLDRSPGALSLELHEAPGNPHEPAVTPAAPATGSPDNSYGLTLSEDVQQQSAAAPAITGAPGRLAALEPLAPLRAPLLSNKLAPLAPVLRAQGLAAQPGAAGRVPVSSEGLKEELRRAGLLASPDGASPGQHSNSSSPQPRSPAGDASNDRALEVLAEQSVAHVASPTNAAAPVGSQADVDLDSDAERELQAVADSAAAEYTTAAHDTGSTAAVGYASAGGRDLSSDYDSSEGDSDDFTIEEQRLMFEGANRGLAQSNQQQEQWSPEQRAQLQQQPGPEAQQQWQQQQQQQVHGEDADSNSEVEIPEDISLTLEGLEIGDDDNDAYNGMLETALQQTAVPASTRDAAISSGLQQRPVPAAAGMSMGETGFSLSDRSGDIDNLPSAADFMLDADDF